ncbi:hypothetical protein [Streptosporangium sp. NPDC049376]|uniref:aromatic-ring hydroxylase C-terminal domain-containing protein n=1 Tax=Streptosporangium sp. NPDC049376 TaxID=3366192 RepID=UPI0037B55FF4
MTVDARQVGAREVSAPRDVSHFAGLRLDAADVDTGALPPRLPGPASEGIMTSLEAVTGVLEERAVALGARIVHDLLRTADGTTHVFRATSGLAHRYDLGGDQRVVGFTAPDFRFRDGTHLGDLLREGQGVAVDLTAAQSLRETTAGWQGRVRHAPGPVADDLGLGALLIRPDGVVAWAEDPDPDPEAFRRAATRWFGAPTA